MFLRAKPYPPTPDLVFVPPTPVREPPLSRPPPSPSTESASPAISTAPPTPELLTTDQERISSDTIEIYSMYGDDDDELVRPSWPDPKPPPAGEHVYRQQHSSQGSHGSSAYFSAISDSNAHHTYSDPSGRSTPINPASFATSPSTNSHLSSSESPYIGIQPVMPDDFRGATVTRLPVQRKSPPRRQPAPLPDTRYLSATPPQSRPPSTPPLAWQPQAAHLSPQASSSPPRSPNNSPSRPVSISQTTRTSTMSLRLSGKDVSITRSEGEDDDSFLVRTTYAQLEACGVKGDGYVEGVERTRARLGTSRASEIMAAEAIGDDTEKKRELSAQEVQMLASLDRYGFYMTPSHDRLVLLPAPAFAKPLSRVTSAPRNAPTSATSLDALPTPAPPPHETERMEKWGRMLEPRSRDAGGNIEMWAVRHPKTHKLRRRVYKGIPDRWRSAAWASLMADFAKTSVADVAHLKADYFAKLDQASSFDVQIDLDVPRTISGHILFKTRYGLGQRSLFHVLHSFSLYCGKCGYCQGMGPIAAMLLCYFAPERAFACMVHLHDAYRMHDIFSPGFPGLLESIYVQERVMAELMPTVYAAFKKHMVSTTSYATKWYITLFANSVPFQTSLRLWDAFLLEGQDLFVVLAIGVIWAYRDHITSEAASFETILSLLSSFFVPEDENALLSWVAAVLENKKLRADMRRWRSEWKALVADGKDGDVLL